LPGRDFQPLKASDLIGELQADTNRPELFQLEWGLLADELAFSSKAREKSVRLLGVPWLAPFA
jgi:hypothetical protein